MRIITSLSPGPPPGLFFLLPNLYIPHKEETATTPGLPRRFPFSNLYIPYKEETALGAAQGHRAPCTRASPSLWPTVSSLKGMYRLETGKNKGSQVEHRGEWNIEAGRTSRRVEHLGCRGATECCRREGGGRKEGGRREGGVRVSKKHVNYDTRQKYQIFLIFATSEI